MHLFNRFHWVKSLGKLIMVLCSGSHKAAVKVSAGMCPIWWLHWGKTISMIIQIIDTIHFLVMMTKGPQFSLAVGWKQPSDPRGHTQFPAMWSFPPYAVHKVMICFFKPSRRISNPQGTLPNVM